LAAQAWPQLPQLVVLDWRLTHWPLHWVVPGPHLQAPPWHAPPPVQPMPQPPQLFGSIWTSTHDEPQRVRLVEQAPWQMPALQT